MAGEGAEDGPQFSETEMARYASSDFRAGTWVCDLSRLCCISLAMHSGSGTHHTLIPATSHVASLGNNQCRIHFHSCTPMVSLCSQLLSLLLSLCCCSGHDTNVHRIPYQSITWNNQKRFVIARPDKPLATSPGYSRAKPDAMVPSRSSESGAVPNRCHSRGQPDRRPPVGHH